MKDSIKRYEKRKRYEKDKIKSAFALVKEERALFEAKKKLGWLPLDKPYHHGWTKTYELVFPKNATTYDRNYWAEIHKKLNRKVWCASEDFRYKNWRGEWREVTLEPKYLSEREFLKLDDKFHKLFEKRYRQIYRNGPVLPFFYPVSRVYSVYFREKKEKRMITHIRENDPQIESRMAYIHKKLWKEGLWRYAYPDMGNSWWKDDWYDNYYKTLSMKEMMTYDFNQWKETQGDRQ